VKQGEEQGLWKYKKLASDKVNEEKSKNENNN